jgi:bacterioferritin-associated ferredoxin
MYVCVCHAVTDSDIAQAVEGGARTLRDLRVQTGLGSTCGRCVQCAQGCIKEAREGQAHAVVQHFGRDVAGGARVAA